MIPKGNQQQGTAAYARRRLISGRKEGQEMTKAWFLSMRLQ